jgi:glycine C-acetyltransferase
VGFHNPVTFVDLAGRDAVGVPGMICFALDLLSTSSELRKRLFDNAAYFRSRLTEQGFDLLPGEHPIIPVMVGHATLAARLADRLLRRGVHVTAFSYPVVPKDKARIRTQISAAHSREDLERATLAFAEAGADVGLRPFV